MGFAQPLGLLALVGIPAVLVLHLYRRRFRERRVAGLFLFAPDALPAGAGRTRSRLLRTPSLWLELLAALVLGLWLGGFHVGTPDAQRHLVVVLDDSASMNATGPAGNTRDRACEQLRQTIDDLPGDAQVTFVVSGPRPELPAGLRAPAPEARRALEAWAPTRPGHDPTPAWELGLDLAGPDGELLYVTDRSDLVPPPRFRLLALGEAVSNAAIVSARRVARGDEERVFVDVMAWGGGPIAGGVRLEALAEAGTQVIAQRDLTLNPGRTLRLAWTVPASGLPLRVTLAEDALPTDDVVILLAQPRRVVPVHVDLAKKQAAALRLERVFAALKDVQLVEDFRAARLVLTAQPGVAYSGATELVIAAPGEERDAWIGPFLLERRRSLGGLSGPPLLSGISLEGVVWSAGRGALPGLPLALAGEQVLLSEEGPSSGHGTRVHLNLDPVQSNLAASPDWPILLSNLVEHVRLTLPGPLAVNVRVGGEMAVRFLGSPEAAARLSLFDPLGAGRPARGWKQLTWEARRTGIHHLRDGDRDVALFAVNFIDPAESDCWLRDSTDTPAQEPSVEGAASLSARGRLEGRLLALLLLIAAVLDWFVLGRRP